MKTFCIYRDNNLFSKYVPQLLEEGFEIVGTFIVPAGTDYDSVEEEAIVALKSMQGKGVKIIITDDTFWKVARNHRPSGELVSLDSPGSRITRAVNHLVCTTTYFRTRSPESDCGQGLYLRPQVHFV